MNKKINLLTLLTSGLIVAIFCTVFFIQPDKKISEKENRSLSQAPEFSVKSLFSGEYTSSLSGYISDQFPARDIFITVKAYSELLQGKHENNGIIYAKEDTLVARDKITENRISENIDTLKYFKETANVPVSVALLPSVSDVFSERLPDFYPKETDALLWDNFFAYSKKSGLAAPDLYTALCEGNNYYRTDHHYNVYGAYQVYCQLGETLGYTPKGKDFFEQEVVSDNFCGTSMRSSGFYFTKKDKITLFRYEGDTRYNVSADGKQNNLYDMSKLETTDQYAVFLGGNHARVDISSDNSKPKMLIIRDSFADSLAPFLALHYNLVMIDLRYYTENVGQIVKNEKIGGVLVLECINEFAVAKNISYLRRPIE